ncbi:hypothetical protein CXR23_04270 [Brevibacterium aurantiacum]|uniref:Uncharacterized protein n=1 Tax=Brevibacterium aurantiacum TaxID=273384 RepID=A0A3Q9NQ40_BREAU|nr:hypothetical protein CXR23_04270 [Brevibacterium aurantiacum]
MRYQTTPDPQIGISAADPWPYNFHPMLAEGAHGQFMDERCGQVAEDFSSTWSTPTEQTLLKMLCSSPDKYLESLDLVPDIPELDELTAGTALDRFPKLAMSCISADELGDISASRHPAQAAAQRSPDFLSRESQANQTCGGDVRIHNN